MDVLEWFVFSAAFFNTMFVLSLAIWRDPLSSRRGILPNVGDELTFHGLL